MGRHNLSERESCLWQPLRPGTFRDVNFSWKETLSLGLGCLQRFSASIGKHRQAYTESVGIVLLLRDDGIGLFFGGEDFRLLWLSNKWSMYMKSTWMRPSLSWSFLGDFLSRSIAGLIKPHQNSFLLTNSSLDTALIEQLRCQEHLQGQQYLKVRPRFLNSDISDFVFAVGDWDLPRRVAGPSACIAQRSRMHGVCQAGRPPSTTHEAGFQVTGRPDYPDDTTALSKWPATGWSPS